MGKNDMVRRQQERDRLQYNKGMNFGQQFVFDVMMVCLHEKGWGYGRISELSKTLKEKCDYYADAFIRCNEQDARQVQLDNELRAIIKDNQPFFSFNERYPNVKTTGYDRAPVPFKGEVIGAEHMGR